MINFIKINMFISLCHTGSADSSRPAAFWYRKRNNFGDLLTPYLIKALNGREPKYERWRGNRFVAVGSLMHFLHPGDMVWGTGALRPDGPVARASFFAVRGPLTREFLVGLGHKVPEVYGDPGLLIPRLYKIDVNEKYDICIIPHYYDYIIFKRSFKNFKYFEEIKLIDIKSGVKNVINIIASSKVVLSSCLHGLILAEALGKPALRFKVRNWKISGDFKFKDYYEGTGRSNFFTADWIGIDIKIEHIREAYYRANGNIYGFSLNYESLIDVCPFRKGPIVGKIDLL